MVMGCPAPDFLGLDETIFFNDVALLMHLVVPAAIGYALWRILVTDRASPQGSILGLYDRSAPHSELSKSRISGRTVASAVLTTCGVGLAVFDGYHYLKQLLPNLLP